MKYKKWIWLIIILTLPFAFWRLLHATDDYVTYNEKPIIYLYPTTKTDITVKLKNSNNLIHFYPKYSESGWTVTATPDGNLADKKANHSYYALY